MQTQKWLPDTCSCEIEEVYDNGSFIEARVLRKCEAHTDVPDAELYDVIMKENRAKNEAIALLIGARGENFGLHNTLVDADDNVEYAFKKGVSVGWRFDGVGKERELAVTISGAQITEAQQQSLVSRIAEFNNTQIKF